MMSKDKLGVYKCEFKNYEDDSVIKNAIMYKSQKDIKCFYHFGHRILPLISKNIINEYNLTAFSWCPSYLSYSSFNRTAHEVEFKTVYELLDSIKDIKPAFKSDFPSKSFDFCIELLELILINYDE